MNMMENDRNAVGMSMPYFDIQCRDSLSVPVSGPGSCLQSSIPAVQSSTETVTPQLQWIFHNLNSLKQDLELKGVAVSAIRDFVPQYPMGFYDYYCQ